MDFKASVTLRPEFWMLAVICTIFYGCLYPFMSVAVLMFEDGWSFSQSEASIVSGIVYDVSMAFGVVFGIIVDKYGNRISFLCMAICLMFFATVLLMVTYRPNGESAVVSWVPYVCMSFVGVAYMFVAGSLWSAVGIVVRKVQTGVALSLMTTIQMSFVSTVQMAVGPLMEVTGTFSADLGLFLGMAAVSLGVVLALALFDKRHYNILNKADTVGIYKEDVEPCDRYPMERIGEAYRTGSMSLRGSRANSLAGYARIDDEKEHLADSRRASLRRNSGLPSEEPVGRTSLRAQELASGDSESLLTGEAE